MLRELIGKEYNSTIISGDFSSTFNPGRTNRNLQGNRSLEYFLNTAAAAAAAAAKSLQSYLTLCDPRDSSPPGSPLPGPGKNTGVGCHFLLQYMKVKSESEVAQSCPTLSHPMDCSPPGSSIHGIFQARVLEWGAIAINQLNLIILSTTLT